MTFLKYFVDSTLHGTLRKIFFFRKNYRKTCSKHVWTLLGTILSIFWNFEKFLIFLKFFEDSTLHGRLGKIFFSEKLPQNMLKTRLDTFRNDFDHFWNIEKVLIFLKLSKTRSSMEHWAKKSFQKKYPKTCSKHVWTLLGTILSILIILKFF